MNTLATTLHIGSGASRFTLRQTFRKSRYAIYEQSQYGRVVAFEAVKINAHNGYELQGKWIEAAESLPSSEQWGIYGFTCPNERRAMKRVSEMMARERRADI